MATFNVTGAKYALATLSAAGTTTATVGAATFVSGDFGVNQRMVALYSSANAFKGIAWVRRFTSTTVLELENQFVDPVTGLFATQASGDKLLVSKNLSEIVTTGLTWDATNRTASLTAAMVVGTANVETSACIYDENATIQMTDAIVTTGGVTVLGKLISYDGTGRESMVWNRDVWLNPLSTFQGGGAGSYNYTMLRPNGAGGHFFMFGGNLGGSYQSSNFMGIVGAGNGGKSFAFFGTRQNYGCTSPSNGTTWGPNAARHLLYNCLFEATYGNANLVMWGDGTWVGGNITFPQFSAGPLGAFRANGTSNYAAPSGKRALVSDLGQGALIDGITTSTYNFTNLITPAVNSVRTGSAGASTINATFDFQDDYTNLKPNTSIVVRRTVDSVVATSVVNTASSTFTAKVRQATYTSTTTGNLTQTANYTSFDYSVKCYGYQPLSGNYAVVDYSLGTGGTGKNLVLGGLTNQTDDDTTTLALAQALALSSKISGNSTTDTATISGSSTLDEKYDYLIAWGCSSVALVQYPSLSTYPVGSSGSTSIERMKLFVTSGATLTAGAKLKDMSGTKQVEITGTGSTANFSRTTITWAPATYSAQWFVQSGGTLTLTSNSLFTINAQAALGYDTKTMFGANSTLNLTDSTMVFNAQSGATNYNGSVFSAFQANGTATMNITNGTWTINGPTAGSTYVIHTYWSAASAINGFTINGTAASAVALEMGATNQKLTGLTHAGQFNGSSNGTNKQFYVHNDALVYTGTTAPLNTSTARLVKWVWLDPVRSDGGLFRWAVGTQGATGANGQFGVLYFRPTINIEKVDYAPKMRLTPSALASRYVSKIVQTTALSTVALSSFYSDSGFAVNDGALPFVDSLDSKQTINTIDWTLDFRQNGWLGQTVTFTAANAKKGLVTYSASGAVDSNYINDTTGAADALLVTVNETTKVLAAASGTLAWSAQRMYNALVNKWSSFAIEQNIVSGSTGGKLDLANYTVDDSISFVRGTVTDLLSEVKTTGIIESQTNEVPVADVNGSRASVAGTDPEGFGVTWFLRWKKEGVSTWSEATGTGNNTQIVVDQAVYTVQARVPGYDWKTVTFDTALSLSLDLNLQFQVSANNTPQWEMPFNETLANAFQFDLASNRVSVENETGAIIQPGFAELYRATQRIQHLPDLVWVWTSPVTANATSQKILIPDDNPISMFLTEGSNASVKITCPVIYSATGSSADDRVRGNADGFSIILGSPATAESAGLQAGIVAALGGPNYDGETHSLSIIKSVLDLIKTATDAVKGKTDNLPAEPAAVGSAMTLTSGYDAAKTAASQDSITALASDVTSIKTTVEAIEPTDLSGIPAAVRTELATELGRVDVEVSTRSTLTAQDIPEGLTAAEVWAATDRTLTETPGLTSAQAEQLRKVAQLHGVGAELVVTATSRTAGDVSQTITSTEDQTTVSQA